MWHVRVDTAKLHMMAMPRSPSQDRIASQRQCHSDSSRIRSAWISRRDLPAKFGEMTSLNSCMVLSTQCQCYCWCVNSPLTYRTVQKRVTISCTLPVIPEICKPGSKPSGNLTSLLSRTRWLSFETVSSYENEVSKQVQTLQHPELECLRLCHRRFEQVQQLSD